MSQFLNVLSWQLCAKAKNESLTPQSYLVEEENHHPPASCSLSSTCMPWCVCVSTCLPACLSVHALFLFFNISHHMI